MTKLNGTGGEPFSVIAETINVRGPARSGKGFGAQASGHSPFRDLLHTVSKPARHGSSDQDHDGSIKPGMLRARAALLAELDKPGDETVRKLPETAEEFLTNRPDHRHTTIGDQVSEFVHGRMRRRLPAQREGPHRGVDQDLHRRFR